MTAVAADTGAKAPWHFWVVVALGVIWNGFGGVDYTMTHLDRDGWFAMMGVPEAMKGVMDIYPSWMHAVWAFGVWGSVLGTVFLILRNRWAFHAFTISSFGALGSLIYTARTPAVKDVMGIEMPIVIVVICVFFVWYSRLMAQRGVLR